jgi:signal peptidase II
VLAIIGLFMWYRSTPGTDRSRLLALASVTAGAIGNLIDRIRSHQGVVDFLDFGFGDARWPVFNVADIAVTCGAVLLAISLWREDVQAARDKDAG